MGNPCVLCFSAVRLVSDSVKEENIENRNGNSIADYISIRISNCIHIGKCCVHFVFWFCMYICLTTYACSLNSLPSFNCDDNNQNVCINRWKQKPNCINENGWELIELYELRQKETLTTLAQTHTRGANAFEIDFYIVRCKMEWVKYMFCQQNKVYFRSARQTDRKGRITTHTNWYRMRPTNFTNIQ